MTVVGRRVPRAARAGVRALPRRPAAAPDTSRRRRVGRRARPRGAACAAGGPASPLRRRVDVLGLRAARQPVRTDAGRGAGSVSYPWVGERWRDTTSVYGPAFTLRGRADVCDHVGVCSCLALPSVAAAAMCLCVLAAARAGPRGGVRRLEPVVAVHAAGGGHNDAWIGALVVGALTLGALGRKEAAGVAWPSARSSSGSRSSCSRSARSRRGRRAGRSVTSASRLLPSPSSRWRRGSTGSRGWRRSDRSRGTQSDTTSFALPSRLTQLGVPKAVALARGSSIRRRLRMARAPGVARARTRRARRGSAALRAVRDAVVPRVGRACRCRGGPHGRLLALGLTAYLLPQTIPV